MEHLSHFKSREDLTPRPIHEDRGFVRGLHPVWVTDPFEAMVLGVSSDFGHAREREQWAESQWDRIWVRHNRPAEISHQARLVLAWRLTRLLAQHSGLIDVATPLHALPWSAWNAPGPVSCAEVVRTMPLLHYWPDTPTQFNWSDHVPDGYSHWIKPPPENAPESHRNTWTAFVRFMVDRHYMHQGVESDPLLGAMGVKMLLDPRYVGRYWPQPEAIQDFEDELVFKVLELMSGGDTDPASTRARRAFSRLGIVREVQREFNLTLVEAKALIMLSRRLATDLTRSNMEEDKAVMTLQLEGLAEQALAATDLRNQATAFKTLAQIQGLTRNEDIGGMEDVIDALGEVTAREKEADEKRFLEYLDTTEDD